jgi:hypothetical protein
MPQRVSPGSTPSTTVAGDLGGAAAGDLDTHAPRPNTRSRRYQSSLDPQRTLHRGTRTHLDAVRHRL